MPLDKNKIQRFQVLDRCFADWHKMYFVEDLQEACRKALQERDALHPDVSRRTILNDIAEMESNRDWKIDLLPIEQSRYGNRRYYRYADPKYSIWKLDLTEEQLTQLKSILLMLRQFQNFPQYDTIEDIIEQLETKYHFTLANTEGAISFEANDNIDVVQYVGQLFSAIVNKQVLHIVYKPFNKQEQNFILHPYYLKQYNRRWFLFGKVQNNLNVLNLALDRIVSIEPATETYIESNIDFEYYFSDLIGVTHLDIPTEKIVLEFTEVRFPYVISKPIHLSQKIVDKQNRQISIEVKPTKELYQCLLSFGADVHVISPDNVKHQLYEEVRKMLQLYTPMQKPCTVPS